MLNIWIWAISKVIWLLVKKSSNLWLFSNNFSKTVKLKKQLSESLNYYKSVALIKKIFILHYFLSLTPKCVDMWNCIWPLTCVTIKSCSILDYTCLPVCVFAPVLTLTQASGWKCFCVSVCSQASYLLFNFLDPGSFLCQRKWRQDRGKSKQEMDGSFIKNHEPWCY